MEKQEMQPLFAPNAPAENEKTEISLETRLAVFREFLDCNDVNLWHFTSELNPLDISGMNQDLYQVFISLSGCREMVTSYCHSEKLPGFFADDVSLLWLAVPDYENETLRSIYMIGPVFGSAASEQSLVRTFESRHLPPEMLLPTLKLFRKIPVVQQTLLMQYGQLLYRCLTGNRLRKAELKIIMSRSGKSADERITKGEESRQADTSGLSYALEQEIFQAVEDGNINFSHPAVVYSIEPGILNKKDPVRNAKNILISCVTLITRAAIRGGLPARVAYALSDYYIQLSEDSVNTADVYEYMQEAFHDFTERVHECKIHEGRSREIQDCISYLELNVMRSITMDELAKNFGYNKNYLSTKFRKETGMTVGEYLTRLRVKRAAGMLINSQMSIADISAESGFGSLSYFSAQFKKSTGLTPTEFRSHGSMDKIASV